MYNVTKRQSKMLDMLFLGWKLAVEKNKCDCTHTRDGHFDTMPSSKNQDGLRICKCRRCGKELHFDILDGTEKDNLDIADRICDIAKMQLAQGSSENEEVIEKISEAQYRLRAPQICAEDGTDWRCF
jgi:hypothetical protein